MLGLGLQTAIVCADGDNLPAIQLYESIADAIGAGALEAELSL